VLLPLAIPADYSIQHSKGLSSLQFTIDDSLSGVKDHFPRYPLIAGYMQLIWIDFLCHEAFPGCRVGEVIDIKFKAKIVPPALLNISIRSDFFTEDEQAKGVFSFFIEDASEVKTQGKLKILSA